MRRTKIVCTIGPACGTQAQIDALVKHGMNVARLNLSHGTHATHTDYANRVRRAAERHGAIVALMLDTRGPKIRTGTLQGGAMKLVEGTCVKLSCGKRASERGVVPIDYPKFSQKIKKDDKIFIADGSIELVATRVDGGVVECEIITGGLLGDRKGVNVPNVEFDLPPVTSKDKEDLKLAARLKADFIAQSFVRNAADVKEMQACLLKAGCGAHVIAKIEDAQGLRNIDEIISAADGVMVARGDLGVQIPFEDIPIAQKSIVSKCRAQSKPVIIATQMLDSMIRQPQPTRAEVSDVANAILDGADAVMLSGETASGEYPLRALEAMDKIARKTEAGLLSYEPMETKGERLDICKSIGKSVVYSARDLRARAILAYTSKGHTARYISAHRPFTPILAVTADAKELGKLQLLWGVHPALISPPKDTEEVVAKSIAVAKKRHFVGDGDIVIITTGAPLSIQGSTNLMQIRIA